MPDVLLNRCMKVPWGQEKHGLSLELLDIFIAKLLVMVVFQDLESVGTFQLLVVECLEAH